MVICKKKSIWKFHLYLVMNRLQDYRQGVQLKKSLYGLKKSPHAWFDRFRRAVCVIRDILNVMEIIQSSTNIGGSCITILVVYVDDIVITGDDEYEIKNLKERLGKAFEVKDLGPLHYFLGIDCQVIKRDYSLLKEVCS